MSVLRPEDEEQVLTVLAEQSRIQAIVEIRRRSGCDLREALDILTEIEAKIRVGADEEYVEWELFAVGPFRRELRGCLDYPERYYASTRDGATVITTVLGLHTRLAWDVLTAHLGVVPDDLTTHVVDALTADPEALEAVLDERELAAFTRLRDAGFQFYFSPGWAREEL